MTVPLLVLLKGLRMSIHALVFDTFQAQPLSVVTTTVPVSELKLSEALVGARTKVQGVPDCVTVNSCPAMLTIPVRAVTLGLAVTLKTALPLLV